MYVLKKLRPAKIKVLIALVLFLAMTIFVFTLFNSPTVNLPGFSALIGFIFAAIVYLFLSFRFRKGTPEECLNCRHAVAFLGGSWVHVSGGSDKCLTQKCPCHMPVQTGWSD